MSSKSKPSSTRSRRNAIAAGVALLAVAAWAWWPFDRDVDLPPATAPHATVPLAVRFEDDASADGWESERLSGLVTEKLTAIGGIVRGEGRADDWVSESFAGGTLRPDDTKRAFDSAPYVVDRAAQIDSTTETFRGVAGFRELMTSLSAAYERADAMRLEFKLFDIEVSDDTISTRAYVAITGDGREGMLEEHATWRSTWTRREPLQLTSLFLEDYERSQLTGGAELVFTDCTEAALKRRLDGDDLLGHGLPHWYVRIPASLGQSPLGYHGLALGDVNGDGLDDIYVCQPGGIPNQLFIQNHDGTVSERAGSSGVNWMETTTSALLIDIDNDGDQDLVAATSPMVILENDGVGRFEPRLGMPGPGLPTSLAAADYDRDGDLDIFACFSSNDSPIPYHDANNGSPNVLWRNEGNWTFEDVTTDVGLDDNGTRFSFAAAWEDDDNDGDLDLYVANDYGRNNLYRNTNGHFEDVAPQLGVEDISAGMSVTFGDYDHDGSMDLYVSNMFSSAGNRIAYQRDFNPTAAADQRSVFQRHARGNSLFRRVDGGYEDVSVSSGVTMGRWAWCSLFVDINNDTHQDLLVANGNITNEMKDDL